MPDFRLSPELLDRFFARVRFGGDHWLWTGARTSTRPDAYGQIWVDGKKVLAHRLSCALFNGPLEEGCLALHTCHIRLCVCPDHVGPGRHRENMWDRDWSNRVAYGERQGRAKLNEETVRAILKAQGTSSQIAARFGLTRGHVANIRAGRLWRHLHPFYADESRMARTA
jgi:hypothetical protein